MQGNPRGAERGAGVEAVTLPWLQNPVPPHQAQPHRPRPRLWEGTRPQGRHQVSTGRQALSQPGARAPTCPCCMAGAEHTAEGGWRARCGGSSRFLDGSMADVQGGRQADAALSPSGPELAACTHRARAGSPRGEGRGPWVSGVGVSVNMGAFSSWEAGGPWSSRTRRASSLGLCLEEVTAGARPETNAAHRGQAPGLQSEASQPQSHGRLSTTSSHRDGAGPALSAPCLPTPQGQRAWQ